MTGLTNGEEEEMGLTMVVPFLVEDELMSLGPTFSKVKNWGVHTIADAQLITGPGHFFSLQPEQLMDIFRREFESRPVVRQEPWQRTTIEALRNVFPVSGGR